MNLAQYNKAFVPLGVALLLGGFAALGITPEMKIEDVATLIVTAIVVYLVPNKKK